MPSWEQFERYFQRPWLDHQESWLWQHTGPSENQVNYGREFSRLTSIASVMLMLGLVQLGIDLRGLAAAGRRWPADGGHWNGRTPRAALGHSSQTRKLPIEGVVISAICDLQISGGDGNLVIVVNEKVFAFSVVHRL